MLNQDRVKQLYKVALYEQNDEKQYSQVGKYYRSDYIGKEVIKSIFTGTIAYVFLAALWVLANWDAVLVSVNNLEIVNTVMMMAVIYVGYMIVYLFASYIVYAFRYVRGRKELDKYCEDLKVLNQMYEREEKLKM